MSDDRKVTGTITTQADSRERVAYDLALTIAGRDGEGKKDRRYWLDLYYECLNTVRGSKPKPAES